MIALLWSTALPPFTTVSDFSDSYLCYADMPISIAYSRATGFENEAVFMLAWASYCRSWRLTARELWLFRILDSSSI